MKVTWANRVVASGVLLALLAAACGDDDEGSGSATTAAPTDDTGAAEETTTTGAEASGEPVRVMMILDESEAAGLVLPEPQDGATARIERVNAEGGLGGSGRPVELEVCVSELDPNRALDCARQAADDPSIVAVVGNVIQTDVAPILEEAGIALVGHQPTTPGDFSSAISYPLIGGAVAAGGGLATVALSIEGVESVGTLRVGIDVIDQVTQLINGVLQSHGADVLATTVDVAPTATDVSGPVAAASDGVDAVVVTVLPNQVVPILQSRAQQGIEAPFVVAGTAITNEIITSLGDTAEGVYATCSFPPTGVDVPGNATYAADVESAGVEDTQGDLSRLGWTAIDVLDFALQGADTVDRDSVRAALDAVTDYDADGLLPTIDFSAPGTNPSFPAVRNLTIFPCQVTDGEIAPAEADSDFLPVFGG